MVEKKAKNLTMPIELWDEFFRIAPMINSKQQWALASASWLLLMGLSEKARNYVVGQVITSDIGNSFAEIIDRAKSGELSREIEKADGKEVSAPLPPITADTIERWGVAQVTRIVQAVEAQGGPDEAMERLEGSAGRIGGVPDAMVEELREIARVEKMTPEQFLRVIIDQARERQAADQRRIAAKDEGKKRK